ncbi:MAG: hypothetical protein KatS3mg108_0215 [Isosphaeraceae bacterium]|nr:MAG: hypothetical protein KatS3mg108_0215 [Isosphaeraceae bacterium]
MAWARRAVLVGGLGIVVWVVAGCGGPPRAAPVEPELARRALRVALDGWKSGAKPADLKSATPPMTVQDLDWLSGLALVEYEVVGPGRDDDANLRIPVDLVLRDPEGRELRKRVSYVVGTSPSVTVFREL